jgi:hypothetical protein
MPYPTSVISNPKIYQVLGLLPTQRSSSVEFAGSLWNPGSFVSIKPDLTLEPTTTTTAVTGTSSASGSLIAGFCEDGAYGLTTATAVPPNYLNGLVHWPIRLENMIFEMSLASATEANWTTAAGATWLNSMIGLKCGIYRATGGTNPAYARMQVVNPAEVTNKVIEIIGLHPEYSGVAPLDPNPRVLVKIIPGAIQA